jgi:hypothetical protein
VSIHKAYVGSLCFRGVIAYMINMIDMVCSCVGTQDLIVPLATVHSHLCASTYTVRDKSLGSLAARRTSTKHQHWSLGGAVMHCC